MILALCAVIAVAICVYGVAMGFAPVTAENLGSPEFTGPARTYDGEQELVVAAFTRAAEGITGLAATRVGPASLVVDCRPSIFRLDDGFGLVAVLRFKGEAGLTHVSVSGRRKAKVDSRWRAQRGLTELERELRLLVKRSTELKAIA